MRGDLFSSNRFYTLAYEKSPKALDIKDIENIVVTKSILLPVKEFVKFCKDEAGITRQDPKFKVETSFYCAKALIHDEHYVEAVEFIERIPKNYHRLEYHFLKASLLLKLNKTPQCLEEMKIAQGKVTENTSLHFRDLIEVIHARCLLAEGRYAEAVSRFQALSASSNFYLTTLEEQSWAHFKARNLTSSRDILKILISYFTGQDIKNQIFGADVYFRTKYLQAYIELISENREKARDGFTELREEIRKFKKDNFAKLKILENTKQNLLQLKSYSQLLNPQYAFISKFRNDVDTWTTVTELKKIDKNIKFMIALNAEVETLRKLKGDVLLGYLTKVRRLQSHQADYLVAMMNLQLQEAKRNIDSLEFKSNMGQVENYWANRTEGKRTLAEVLDAYKAEVMHVEDYLGK